MTQEETWRKLVEIGAVQGPMPEGLWHLRGAILRGKELVGLNLAGADMESADLRRTYLSEANLSLVRLRNGDLSDAVKAT